MRNFFDPGKRVLYSQCTCLDQLQLSGKASVLASQLNQLETASSCQIRDSLASRLLFEISSSAKLIFKGGK